LINAHLAAGRNPIVIYAGSVAGNPLSAVNVVRFLLKPGQAALAGELPLAWQPGLGGGVQLLELPLLPAADQAARREL
ncbi:hypothetical protein, partial [Salmonella enterica]